MVRPASGHRPGAPESGHEVVPTMVGWPQARATGQPAACGPRPAAPGGAGGGAPEGRPRRECGLGSAAPARRAPGPGVGLRPAAGARRRATAGRAIQPGDRRRAPRGAARRRRGLGASGLRGAGAHRCRALDARGRVRCRAAKGLAVRAGPGRPAPGGQCRVAWPRGPTGVAGRPAPGAAAGGLRAGARRPRGPGDAAAVGPALARGPAAGGHGGG